MAPLEDAFEFVSLNGCSVVPLLRVLLSTEVWHFSIPPGALVTPQQVVSSVNIILLYQHAGVFQLCLLWNSLTGSGNIQAVNLKLHAHFIAGLEIIS